MQLGEVHLVFMKVHVPCKCEPDRSWCAPNVSLQTPWSFWKVWCLLCCWALRQAPATFVSFRLQVVELIQNSSAPASKPVTPRRQFALDIDSSL